MTIQSPVANAAITVLCSNSSRAVMDELIPQFQRASGHKVAIKYDTAQLTLKRIAKGEVADVVILNAPAIDELTQQGRVASASRRELARCSVGIAVRAGAAKPDISSIWALKRALLAAKSIAYTEAGASGIYFAGLIEQLEIAEQVRAKAHTRPGGLIGRLVARGDAELAVQQIPELMAVKGIDLVGPLPREVQSVSVITAGIFADARRPQAAHALISFLSTPAAARVYQAKGLDPA